MASNAVRELPNLTPFGVSVHYTYHRRGNDAVAAEIRKQQAELFTEHSLTMVACCSDWIHDHTAEINGRRSSYYYKHLVEQHRRDNGDLDPYVHNGCFIAAALGLGFNWKIDGPNVIFRRPTLRQRVDNELVSHGQRLRGNNIVQTHEEPMMFPFGERVVARDIDLNELAQKLGVRR